MDFPTIEAEAPPRAAPTTAVAVVTVKDAALAQFSKTEADLRALAKRHADVVFDLTTPKGLKAAKEARQELREGRFAVQRIEAKTKDDLNDLKRTLKEHAEKLVAIVKPTEDAVHGQIEAHEKAVAEAKAKEEARKHAHIDNIATIVNYPQRAHGQPADKLAGAIAYVEAIDVSEAKFEEFAGSAANAKDQTLAKLRELHAEAVEAARIRAEHEAQQRTVRQLSALSSAVTDCMGQHSGFIERRLLEFTLPEGASPEVSGAYMNARVQLEMLLTMARQNEALRAQLAPPPAVPPGPVVATPEGDRGPSVPRSQAEMEHAEHVQRGGSDEPGQGVDIDAVHTKPEPVRSVSALPTSRPVDKAKQRLGAAAALARGFNGFEDIDGSWTFHIGDLADLIDHVRAL